MSGQDLIDAGMSQGKWFRRPSMPPCGFEQGRLDCGRTGSSKAFQPGPTLALRAENDIEIYSNIRAENAFERENVEKVHATMRALVRTPVVRSAAIMPDACPAGPIGTIPVGGVVASEAIHPGMHSADICCSMAISIFPSVDPKSLLDAVNSIAHFGPGGRPRGAQFKPLETTLSAFERNPYLQGASLNVAIEHFATQGDGNHFAYVGTMKSTGETALVTHHGSRAAGARLYDKGMKVATGFASSYRPKPIARMPGSRRYRGRRSLLVRVADDPPMDKGKPLCPSRHGGRKTLGEGGRSLLERAQFRFSEV